MGSKSDWFDNALAESFVDSFKTELIADRVWQTRSQLELAIVEWVGWFNHVRLHQALADIPPAEFEDKALCAMKTRDRLRWHTPVERKLTNPVSVEPSPAQVDPRAARPHRRPASTSRGAALSP